MAQSAASPDRQLIDQTRPFATENRAESIFQVCITFALLAVALTIAARGTPWPLRLAASGVSGLIIVRGFILYHDFMHGAILKKSRFARYVMHTYGVLVLTPPRVWRHTHNYHHAHTAKIVGSHVGSYAMMTTHMWAKASRRDRFRYRLARHPLIILFAYLTVFVYGMCLSPLIRDFRRHWDSAVALIVHAALFGLIGWVGGADVLFFAFILPLALSFVMGAYLFYAQHNFDDIHIQPREGWSFTRAALESSSYMKLGPVMRWFTGNIGYHHVHHLNPSIPFYRLPETMDAIPELQSPRTTSLWPREILRCLRLKLWDPDTERMVPFP